MIMEGGPGADGAMPTRMKLNRKGTQLSNNWVLEKKKILRCVSVGEWLDDVTGSLAHATRSIRGYRV